MTNASINKFIIAVNFRRKLPLTFFQKLISTSPSKTWMRTSLTMISLREKPSWILKMELWMMKKVAQQARWHRVEVGGARVGKSGAGVEEGKAVVGEDRVGMEEGREMLKQGQVHPKEEEVDPEVEVEGPGLAVLDTGLFVSTIVQV